MSIKRVKVTDRRMFTLEGELRNEFREYDNAAPGEPESDGLSQQAPPPRAPEPRSPPTASAWAPSAPAPAAPRADGYPARLEADGPSVLDLIGLLAEPASLYLREARSGDASTIADSARAEQGLELARLHIDLLGILQEKTAGNLSSEEKAMLDDVVYRLQTGFVQTQK